MEKEPIISKEDLEVITKIADKYNFSVADLGKMLCRKKMNYPKFQISCNEKEYEIIEKKAKRCNLSLSRYCLSCFEKAIAPENINEISFLEIFEGLRKGRKEKTSEEKERKRINICLKSNEDYLNAKEISKKLNVPLGVLARYAALNIEL